MIKFSETLRVAILRVTYDRAKDLGYRIGYRTTKWESRLMAEVLFQEFLAVRLCREDRTYFVINMFDEEVGLAVERLTTMDDPALGRNVRMV
jgi:hypothetical protein